MSTKHNKGTFQWAYNQARQLAQKDGRVRYVFTGGLDFTITLRKPKLPQDFLCIGAADYARATWNPASARHEWEQKQYE